VAVITRAYTNPQQGLLELPVHSEKCLLPKSLLQSTVEAEGEGRCDYIVWVPTEPLVNANTPFSRHKLE